MKIASKLAAFGVTVAVLGTFATATIANAEETDKPESAIVTVNGSAGILG